MVQAEKCSYHSEGLFSRKGLPSSTALEPSGERKKNILQDWVQNMSTGGGNSVTGLTSNLCAAQGESPTPGTGKKRQHTQGEWSMEILFRRTRKGLEF